MTTSPTPPLAILTQVVDEFGEDYVYTAGQCRYADHDNEPSCLVGQIISRMNPPEGLLTRMDSSGLARFRYLWMTSHEMLNRPDFKPTTVGITRDDAQWLANNFDRATVEALTIAQTNQDVRNPWGECRTKAKETYRNMTINAH